MCSAFSSTAGFTVVGIISSPTKSKFAARTLTFSPPGFTTSSVNMLPYFWQDFDCNQVRLHVTEHLGLSPVEVRPSRQALHHPHGAVSACTVRQWSPRFPPRSDGLGPTICSTMPICSCSSGISSLFADFNDSFLLRACNNSSAKPREFASAVSLHTLEAAEKLRLGPQHGQHWARLSAAVFLRASSTGSFSTSGPATRRAFQRLEAPPCSDPQSNSEKTQNPWAKTEKEEGRRKKEEGRRKKEEGRRKKEEGRRKKERTFRNQVSGDGVHRQR